MLLSHPENIKKSPDLNAMEFVRLIRKPPPPKPKPKPKPIQEKKVEQVKEIEKPKPKKVEHVVKQPTKVQKVVKQAPPQPIPKFDMPTFDLPTRPVPSATAPVVKAAPPVAASKPVKKAAHNGESGHSSAVSSVVAIYRVQPNYPAQARRQHIEGWVKVEFTVTTVGTVANPRIVAAEPDGIFDSAVLSAIAKWKFKQKIVDGQAVTQRAVQTLKFTLVD